MSRNTKLITSSHFMTLPSARLSSRQPARAWLPVRHSTPRPGQKSANKTAQAQPHSLTTKCETHPSAATPACKEEMKRTALSGKQKHQQQVENTCNQSRKAVTYRTKRTHFHSKKEPTQPTPLLGHPSLQLLRFPAHRVPSHKSLSSQGNA